MQTDLALRCRCGAFRGVARAVSARTGNHLVCYCRDCQAFARFLGTGGLLDAAGGSAIYQLTPAQLSFTEGRERLQCVRLSEKGMVRWYTDCCKTPVANTMVTSRAPFAGLLVALVDPAEDARSREEALGPVVARSFARDAFGPVAAPSHRGIPLSFVPRMIGLVARGVLRRKGQPSPFFAPGARAPRVAPRVLMPDERARLGP